MNIDSIFFYWEQRKFENIFNYERPDKYIVTSTEYLEFGPTPVLTANKAFILGYTTEKNKYVNSHESIIFDDFTLDTKFVDFPYMVKSSAIKILTLKDEKKDNIRFNFDLLSNHRFNMLGHARHYISVVQPEEVFTTNKQEQNKIGELFTNLDNLITLHQRKFNYILSHKLEIKLFFFKITKNVWEQRKLGDISFSYSGGTPNVGNNSYYGGSIPFIRSGEIKEKHTELFLTEEGFKNSSSKMVEKGDILYALYGATSGEVSISLINGAINQAILAIRPQCPYNNYFISQWLKKEKNNITSTYLQGGQGNLSGEIVKNLEINFPKQNIEQDKIGEIFTNLDNLITLHQHKELKRRNDNNDNLRW